ncbi:zinc finger protein 184-like [Musca vetustissima]|uniref:zinc finger protein 184-like n=1 Tax=Musca vetustissima TaxID=27455 RepID=UPI002AB72C2A|nr:zinc finger protein 184-like [Musca vetustissima]
MERHMIFVCPECGQTTDSQHEWRQHLNTVHDYNNKTATDFGFRIIDNKYHECQICLKRLTHGLHSLVVLQNHRFSHLSYGGPFKCRYCAGTYVKKRALSVHLFRCHSQRMNKLDNEYKMEKMRQAITLRHPRFNREFFMRFICPQCGKLFQRFNEWLEHIDMDHVGTSEALNMHRIIHTRDYYCSDCSLTLKNGPTKDQLRRHRFSHLPYSAYFQCAFCVTQKSFKTDLFLHFIRYHRGEFLKNKKYICPPNEWAGPARAMTLRQIQIFMADERPEVIERKIHSKVPKPDVNDLQRSSSFCTTIAPTRVNDILQKALAESCIDLEQEQEEAESEIAIVNNYEEFDDNDLEAICLEMFEELPEENECPEKRFKIDENDSNNNTIAELQRREMQKYINYLCPECLKEFDNQPDWRNHVFDDHNLANAIKTKFHPLNAPRTSSYLCLSCYQVQKTTKHVDLQRHYFQHMPHQSYLKCNLCQKTKSSKSRMLQHLDFIHRIKMPFATTKVQCLECDIIFEGSLREHLKQCTAHLKPLSIAQYDNIAKNTKILEHLKKASQRLDKTLLELGIDPSQF